MIVLRGCLRHGAGLGLFRGEEWASGWGSVFVLGSLQQTWRGGLAGVQSWRWGQCCRVPQAPGPTPPPLPSSAGPGSFTSGPVLGEGSWGPEGPPVLPSSPPPPHLQLRRSPIKKVRKSLALDIVDEDGKLMSTVPKAVSLVRGLRDAPPMQRLFYPACGGTLPGGSVSGAV